jgi:ribosomal protein S5
MDANDEFLKEEMKQEKQEEIEMLQEFERRRKFKSAYETLEEEKGHLKMKDNNEKRKDRDEGNLADILRPDVENGEMFDSTKFTLIFLDAGMVCNMTRLNRVYERRILLYMGNKQGLISYGIGRDTLYQAAFKQAYRELRKNLLIIKWDPEFTCPTDLKARFNDYRLYLRSTYNPSIYGNPLMALMLRYAGMYHCYFIIKSRLKEPYAMVFSFFKAVTRNLTVRDVCETFGTKPYKHYIGRPNRYEHSLLHGQNS